MRAEAASSSMDHSDARPLGRRESRGTIPVTLKSWEKRNVSGDRRCTQVARVEIDSYLLIALWFKLGELKNFTIALLFTSGCLPHSFAGRLVMRGDTVHERCKAKSPAPTAIQGNRNWLPRLRPNQGP